jgi:hypothetical protein
MIPLGRVVITAKWAADQKKVWEEESPTLEDT